MAERAMAKEGHRDHGSRATLTSSVYGDLKNEIISATLMPGARLQTRALSERFGMGLSPIREALSMLASEGLVARRDRRGFIVAPISQHDVDDLTRARCWINEIGLRQSFLNGGEQWEEGIVLSLHRLVQTPRTRPGAGSDRNPDWELAHARFHRALLAGCGSEWLVNAASQMFGAAERYRHIARLAGATRPPNREHREIVNAVMKRDVERAVTLLNSHLRWTADIVRQVLSKEPALANLPRRKAANAGVAAETRPRGARRRAAPDRPVPSPEER